MPRSGLAATVRALFGQAGWRLPCPIEIYSEPKSLKLQLSIATAKIARLA
jgi:hypothetical protein